MIKQFLNWLKVRQIEKNGGVLWTRWDDKDKILFKTFGEVIPNSPSAYVPCSTIVISHECDHRNGYYGYVLAEGWTELAQHLQKNGGTNISLAVWLHFSGIEVSNRMKDALGL